MAKQKKKATFLKETLIERTNMFETLIQQLTDDHDQIITEFQEKINSDESFYVLIAEIYNPTHIYFHIETEYDGRQIEGLCLKLITIYVDRHETHSKDEIKASIENELTHIKERLERFVPQFSDNTRVIMPSQLEQIESTQPTELYDNALKKPAKITQEAKIFNPNRFSTYFEEK